MEDKDAAAPTAPAAAMTKLTLMSLPPEIILSIVEWVERIVRADKVRQEDALLDDEEEAAMAAAAAVEGDGDGEDEMMFQMPPQPAAAAAAAAEANIGGAGIGGAGFLNNLFGWATGGGGGAGGAAAGAAHAPQGNAANAANLGGFAAINVGPQPAGLAGLMQALGGHPGQGMPTLGGQPGGADGDDTDDEMPPLETLPEFGTHGGSATGSAGSAGNNASPSNATAASAAPLAGGNDEEMPDLEASSDDEQTPHAGSSVATATALPATTPFSPASTASGNDAASTANTGTPLFSPPPPLTPATPSVTGSLAHEVAIHNAQNAYTEQELAEMPDLTSPTTDAAASEAAEDTISEGQDGSDWEDEDELLDEDDEDDEDGDEDDDDDNDHSTESGEDTSEADPSNSTYVDGLPSDPILPLAFISRSFLNATRTILYARAVSITDAYQASLFLRTLTSPVVSINGDAASEPEADDDEAHQRSSLAHCVRSIVFDIRKPMSLGRGGGQVILDIIKLCPRIDTLALSMDWTRSCLIPLQSALKGAVGIKSISLRSGEDRRKELVWDMKNLEPLLSTWKHLEDLQIAWLKTAPSPKAPAGSAASTSSMHPALAKRLPLAGSIKKLSLNHVDITDADLAYLLSNTGTELSIFEVHVPSERLTRVGIASTLIRHGANIKSVQIDLSPTWHPTNPAMASAPSAAMSSAELAAGTRYLIDGLLGHMPKLEELKLSGSLMSTLGIARLPKSIQVLALEDNLGVDVKRLIGLLKKKRKVKVNPQTGKAGKVVPEVVPKLRCLTYARSDNMRPNDELRTALASIMRARKACLHWTYKGAGGPAAVWGGVEDEDAFGFGPFLDAHPGVLPPGMAMPFPIPFGPGGPIDPADFMEMFGPPVGGGGAGGPGGIPGAFF